MMREFLSYCFFSSVKKCGTSRSGRGRKKLDMCGMGQSVIQKGERKKGGLIGKVWLNWGAMLTKHVKYEVMNLK